MGLKDVGVRFVTEGLSQFNAALNSANKSVAGVGTAATDASKTVQKGWAGLKSTLTNPAMWSMAAGYIGVVAGALGSAAAAAKKYADEYMAYALQVKDFARTIGATPEEASKLIQVADDVRLSTGSMTTAFRTAITRGIAPTIENLGRLSDQYLAIQDPIARSKFLLDTFGRAGLEMGKLMELGSQKIREMGDSIEGTSRLMTQKGIKAAEDYYAALDNLSDSSQNVSLAIGQKMVPIVTKAANVMNDMAGNIQNSALPAILALDKARRDGDVTRFEELQLLYGYISGSKTAGDIDNFLVGRKASLGQAINGTNIATLEYIQNLIIMGSTAAQTATQEEILAQATKDTQLAMGYASAAIGKYVTDQNLARLATDALALATGELTENDLSLRGSIDLLTQMMQSRILTPQQWAGAMALLKDNTKTAAEKVKLLQQYIDGLHDKEITVGVTVLMNLQSWMNSPAGQAVFGAILGWGSGTGATPPQAPAPRMPPTTNNPRTEKPWTPAELETWRRNHPNGARGLNMIVPSGFRGDTFPIWASSGERVVVMTAQQQREMNRSMFSGMMGSVSQIASPSQIYTNNTSAVNVSMPISATVRNDADIRVLAYAISKEIAANVRA